jgi:hypothetical protein
VVRELTGLVARHPWLCTGPAGRPRRWPSTAAPAGGSWTSPAWNRSRSCATCTRAILGRDPRLPAASPARRRPRLRATDHLGRALALVESPATATNRPAVTAHWPRPTCTAAIRAMPSPPPATWPRR